jgi:hypothetical protein
VGGQKPTVTTGLRLTRKLKQKKFKDGDFLILFLISKNHQFFFKKFKKLLIKNKIKRLTFVKKIFLFNFYFGLKPLIILDFMTPHVSEDLTTVKSSEPAPPQGGS